MKSFPTIFLALLIALLTVTPSAYASMTYEYDLPQLVGNHTYLDKPFTIPFDLNARFSSIASVELRLEGNATIGSAILTNRNPPVDIPLMVEFHVRIADTFEPHQIDLRIPDAHFVQLNDYFNLQRPFAARARKQRGAIDWSFLHDGSGEIHFSWSGGCPDACTFVNNATLVISRATMVIKGTMQY